MKKQTKTEGVRYAQTYPLLIYPYAIAFSLLLNHAITLLFHNSKRSMQHTMRDCNKKNARWRKEHNIRNLQRALAFCFWCETKYGEKKLTPSQGRLNPYSMVHASIICFTI